MNLDRSAVVLLAEDNDDDVFLMKRAFERARILSRLCVVRDGVEAMDYLQGTGQFSDRSRYPLPCLCLLDIKMPKMNGFDVLRQIREHPATRRLPVVFLTSSNQRCDIDQAYDLGANSYLVKPPDADSLHAMLQSLQGYWFSMNELPQYPQEEESIS